MAKWPEVPDPELSPEPGFDIIEEMDYDEDPMDEDELSAYGFRVIVPA